MKQVENQDEGGDAFRRNLDPPLKKERKEKDSNQAFTSQSRPGTFWLSFAKCGTCNYKAVLILTANSVLVLFLVYDIQSYDIVFGTLWSSELL